MSNFMKTRPVGAELFHADRHTTKLTVAFRNSAKAPKLEEPAATTAVLLWNAQ